MYNLTVVAGTPQVFVANGGGNSIPFPATIKVTPGSGGTLLVEYRISPTGDFTAWPAGTVSVTTTMKLDGPVEAIRFTAAVANGTCEVAQ